MANISPDSSTKNIVKLYNSMAEKYSQDALASLNETIAKTKEAEMLANLARDWATKVGGVVEDIDFSSKYYAAQSRAAYNDTAELIGSFDEDKVLEAINNAREVANQLLNEYNRMYFGENPEDNYKVFTKVEFDDEGNLLNHVYRVNSSGDVTDGDYETDDNGEYFTEECTIYKWYKLLQDVQDKEDAHEANVQDLIDAYQDATELAIENFKNAINTTVADFKQEVNTAEETHRTDVQSLINTYKNDTDSVINTFKTNVNADITQFKQDVNAAETAHKTELQTMFDNLTDETVGEVYQAKATSIDEITATKTESITTISALKTEALSNIESARASSLSDISNANTSSLESISSSRTEALNTILSLKTETLDYISSVFSDTTETMSVKASETLATINTARTSAINEVNTICENAVNSINASKTEALTTISNTRTETLTTIDSSRTNALSELSDAKEEAVNAVRNMPINMLWESFASSDWISVDDKYVITIENMPVAYGVYKNVNGTKQSVFNVDISISPSGDVTLTSLSAFDGYVFGVPNTLSYEGEDEDNNEFTDEELEEATVDSFDDTPIDEPISDTVEEIDF